MNPSLSIILHVCNAQDRLAGQVQELLETAADLSGKVELLIVDHGSNDQTEDISMELSRRYPQVRVLRRSTQMGAMAAARIGIDHTSGEIVVIHDIESPLKSNAIRRLWMMRDDGELMYVRSESAHPSPRTTGRRPSRSASVWTGTQLLRRETMRGL